MEKNQKSSKILRFVNIAVASALFLFVLAFFLKIVITGEDPDNRLLATLGVMALTLIPVIFEIFFHRFLDPLILTFYIIYVFFAAVLGNVLSFYGRFSGYDKIMHTLFGYVGAFAGFLIICRTEKGKSLSPFTVILFCFAFSLMCGALWEIFEFTGDKLLGQTSQGVPATIDGVSYTDVSDTMFDIICNTGGAVVFAVHYLIHFLTKKSLGLGHFEGPNT